MKNKKMTYKLDVKSDGLRWIHNELPLVYDSIAFFS